MSLPSRSRTTEGFHRISDILKCKWTMAIIDAIARGINRPSQVQRALPGLTAKVLNERVSKLERYNILEREVFAEVPPRVEYRLTQNGKRLIALLDEVRQFIYETWPNES